MKNEYRCIEYPTQRIEHVHIGRLGEAERRERRLHARGSVPQQIQIVHGAGRVANLQFDTVAIKYYGIALRDAIVTGP
jgi:hypothetical protein